MHFSQLQRDSAASKFFRISCSTPKNTQILEKSQISFCITEAKQHLRRVLKIFQLNRNTQDVIRESRVRTI